MEYQKLIFQAKLPRGIDKIRPHIELIDNVPLLVSLFTDCNTEVTREMLHIMQDYGEVVCVLGSSANAENMAIFMQADAAWVNTQKSTQFLIKFGFEVIDIRDRSSGLWDSNYSSLFGR